MAMWKWRRDRSGAAAGTPGATAAGAGEEQKLPGASGASAALPTPGFRTPSCRQCERTHFCRVSHRAVCHGSPGRVTGQENLFLVGTSLRFFKHELLRIKYNPPSVYAVLNMGLCRSNHLHIYLKLNSHSVYTENPLILNPLIS